jgi:hypothetical protein
VVWCGVAFRSGDGSSGGTKVKIDGFTVVFTLAQHADTDPEVRSLVLPSSVLPAVSALSVSAECCVLSRWVSDLSAARLLRDDAECPASCPARRGSVRFGQHCAAWLARSAFLRSVVAHSAASVRSSVCLGDLLQVQKRAQVALEAILAARQSSS